MANAFQRGLELISFGLYRPNTNEMIQAAAESHSQPWQEPDYTPEETHILAQHGCEHCGALSPRGSTRCQGCNRRI